MQRLTIGLNHPAADGTCPLCDRPLPPAPDTGLALTDGTAPVCADCGRRHARPLVALLDLARVARRVGTIGRHTVAPPMEALLDLARAAEHYAFVTAERSRRVA